MKGTGTKQGEINFLIIIELIIIEVVLVAFLALISWMVSARPKLLDIKNYPPLLGKYVAVIGSQVHFEDDSVYGTTTYPGLQLAAVRAYTHDDAGRLTGEYYYKCRHSEVLKEDEFFLSSYQLAGYDSYGNCVYQKSEKEGDAQAAELFYLYQYNEKGQIINRAVYAGNTLQSVEDYRYLEDGGMIHMTRECRGGIPQDNAFYVEILDGDGREAAAGQYDCAAKQLAPAAGVPEGTGDAGRNGGIFPGGSSSEVLTRESRRMGDLEEIGYTEGYLAYYRWICRQEDYRREYMVEVLPEWENGHFYGYKAFFIRYEYDLEGLLKQEYIYEVKDDFRKSSRATEWRDGMAVYLDFGQGGNLSEVSSCYFPTPEGAGEYIYILQFERGGRFVKKP